MTMHLVIMQENVLFFKEIYNDVFWDKMSWYLRFKILQQIKYTQSKT